MTTISTLEARKKLADVINSAQYGKERIILTRMERQLPELFPLMTWNYWKN